MLPITALCHLVESTEIICALPVTHTQILGYVVTSSKIVDEAHGFQSKIHTPIQVWFGSVIQENATSPKLANLKATARPFPNIAKMKPNYINSK